jgi:hypothetical protein
VAEPDQPRRYFLNISSPAFICCDILPQPLPLLAYSDFHGNRNALLR